MRTLSPESMLLVLCVHGTKHAWTRSMWIADIVAVVFNHPELDWTYVFSEAERMGVRRMLTVGLSLATDYGLGHLPDEIKSAIAEPRTSETAAAVRSWLRADASGSEHPLRRSLFHVRIRERFSDKIRVALYAALVPSDKDRLIVGLSPAFALLYYLLRPLRLAGKYLRRFVGARQPCSPSFLR